MARALLKFWMLFAATTLFAAGSVLASLETHLRAERPEVLRWEIAEMAGSAHRETPSGEVAHVGSIGPRTAVRFSDGRVRWYSVTGIAPVMASRHAIAAGGEVTPADLESAEHDVIAMGCAPVTSLDAKRRWRSTRRLSAGEPLCTNSIEPAPQVQRGAAVTLSSERGAIRVTRVLVANNDAWTGERVRLRDPASGETVPAIVTGTGAARVNEEN